VNSDRPRRDGVRRGFVTGAAVAVEREVLGVAVGFVEVPEIRGLGPVPVRVTGALLRVNLRVLSSVVLQAPSFKRDNRRLQRRFVDCSGRRSEEESSRAGRASRSGACSSARPRRPRTGAGATRAPSPSPPPTGIGLHLNSLTSAVPFKREYPASGGESASEVPQVLHKSGVGLRVV
jgi:hypothetical protein